ncbi:hypothetical protein B0I35DRAFT_194510 [Stachybotrys elegans]|uniref:Uncharacterized protein n=1 Tax=Stachybotrys elegans TaxID=80388 RepID=A0A8K0WTB2_9HYPO|nr:hypothetical protein B0I35DRAFT_194510 [Stachybotrys elegans]
MPRASMANLKPMTAMILMQRTSAAFVPTMKIHKAPEPGATTPAGVIRNCKVLKTASSSSPAPFISFMPNAWPYYDPAQALSYFHGLQGGSCAA